MKTTCILTLLLIAISIPQSATSAVEPSKSAAAPSSKAPQHLVGTWRFTNARTGWSGIRTINEDGTFTGDGVEGIGKWVVIDDKVVLSYPAGTKDQMVLPLDPKQTKVIIRRGTTITAAREPTEPAVVEAKEAPPSPSVKEPPPENPEMQKWLSTLDAEWQAILKRDITDPHEAALKNVGIQYRAELEEAIKKLGNAGDLDSAVALREEQRRFEGTNSVPEQDQPSDLAAVKQVRAASRAKIAQLAKELAVRVVALRNKYDQALAQAQTKLTQHGRLDDALLVKAKRAEIAEAWLTPEIKAAVEQVEPTPKAP